MRNKFICGCAEEENGRIRVKRFQIKQSFDKLSSFVVDFKVYFRVEMMFQSKKKQERQQIFVKQP